MSDDTPRDSIDDHLDAGLEAAFGSGDDTAWLRSALATVWIYGAMLQGKSEAG